MGGGNRNKFERYHSDKEEDSSDDEIITSSSLNEETSDISTNEEINGNNSNNQNQKDSGKSISNNQKFLVTRSKRKYNKPELILPMNKRTKNSVRIKKGEEKNSKLNSTDEPLIHQQDIGQNKPKRETIKSLDSKIEKAASFLEVLNKKLAERDDEIAKLKEAISRDRSVNGHEFVNMISEKESSEDAEPIDLQIRIPPGEDEMFTENDSSASEPEQRQIKPSRSRSEDRGRKRRRRSRSKSRSRSRSKS